MTANGQNGNKMSLKDKVTISKFHSFGAKTLEDYAKKLKGWNIVELCSHAAKYGLNPNVDRKRVEKALLDEFRKAKAAFDNATGATQGSAPPITEDREQRIKDRLAFIRS